MALSPEIREFVRRRAGYACEFCGVSEVDAGGELTIDHFHPTSKGGDDSLENLVYCCHRCNLYKSDYWPAHPDAPRLWNPRREPINLHFIPKFDGFLLPVTPTGSFTAERLHLNRPQLIAYRLHQTRFVRQQLQLTRYILLVGEILKAIEQQHGLANRHERIEQTLKQILKRFFDTMDGGFNE